MLTLPVQLGIPGQVRFQQGDLLNQPGVQGLSVQLPGPGLLRLGQKGGFPGQLLLHLGQRLPALLLLPGHGQPGVDGFQLLFQFFQFFLEPEGMGFVLLQNPGDEGGGFLHGQLPRPGLAEFFRQFTLLRAKHPGDILLHTFPGIAAPVVQGPGLPLQALLQALEPVGFEYFPKNQLPVLGGSQQQLEKISLGDHGDLHELVPVQSQNIPDGGVHLPGLGDGVALGQDQAGLRPLGGGAGAVKLGPLVFRHPPDGIALLPAEKFQLHKGGRLRGGVLGAEHTRAAVVAAGLAIEGEGDGIEQGGFSRAGVAGDEVESILPQAVQVQHGPAGIGAEGGNGEFCGSHDQTSSVRAISSSRKTSCSAVMGRLFCNS